MEAWSFSPMPGIKERLTGFNGLQGERWGCQPRCRWFAKDFWITCITDLQKVLEFLQAWNWLFLKALLSPQQSSAKGALPAVSRYDWFAARVSKTRRSQRFHEFMWQSYGNHIVIYIYVPGSGSPPHPPCHGHGHNLIPPPPCGMGGPWEGVGVIQPPSNSNVTW